MNFGIALGSGELDLPLGLELDLLDLPRHPELDLPLCLVLDCLELLCLPSKVLDFLLTVLSGETDVLLIVSFSFVGFKDCSSSGTRSGDLFLDFKNSSNNSRILLS
jgi:hypothetical protein